MPELWSGYQISCGWFDDLIYHEEVKTISISVIIMFIRINTKAKTDACIFAILKQHRPLYPGLDTNLLNIITLIHYVTPITNTIYALGPLQGNCSFTTANISCSMNVVTCDYSEICCTVSLHCILLVDIDSDL